jgi:hypothetical protein
LQITAALLITDPALTAAELAGDLAAESARLQLLVYDGSGTRALSVAAAFELCYRRLDDTTARVFRLLPVNPGPDVSTAAAAALVGLPVKQAQAVLADRAPDQTARHRGVDSLRPGRDCPAAVDGAGERPGPELGAHAVTVLFGLATLQLSGAFTQPVSHAGPGATALYYAVALLFVAAWLAGAAVVWLLWRPASSTFFKPQTFTQALPRHS